MCRPIPAAACCAAAILALTAAASAQMLPAPIRDPAHQIEVRPLSWKELRQRNLVMQNREYTCGAAAVATVLHYYWGDPADENRVLEAITGLLTDEEMRDRVKNGLAISDLRRAAVRMGYRASIGTLSFDKLTEARVPLIVPIRLAQYDHFVVYRGVADGRVYLADPVRGNVRPTIAEFCGQWQKHAVLVVVKPDVEPPTDSPLALREAEVCLGDTTLHTIRRQLALPSLPPPSP